MHISTSIEYFPNQIGHPSFEKTPTCPKSKRAPLRLGSRLSETTTVNAFLFIQRTFIYSFVYVKNVVAYSLEHGWEQKSKNWEEEAEERKQKQHQKNELKGCGDIHW